MKPLDGARPAELSAGQLVQRITDRGGELLECQLAMARAELVRDFDARVRNLGRLAAALLSLVCGVNLLLVALVLALPATWSGWIVAAVLALPLLLGGAIVLRTARAAITAVPMKETTRALKADWRWLRALKP